MNYIVRLNSQPSHIVSFLPGMTTCARWGRGDGVLVGIKTPRPHVPVQQVRRPVRLAPRPRDEADGVVLAPAAPFLAEAALGDAGHFFSRSSRWLAAVFAALLVVRAASGGLGLSARALRSLQLCLLLFCRLQRPPGF